MARLTVPLVFVGPSYPTAAADYPSLDVRPPAARGDVLRVVREGARVVGLIDGVFGSRLAVTPTELRQAHREGARILGAASMGALRAAECPGVVEPVGGIAEAFVRGELADEDLLACTFDPDSYGTVSHALVNVHGALRRLAQTEPLLATQLPSILDALGRTPFDRRTTRDVVSVTDAYVGPRLSRRLAEYLADSDSDLKRADAVWLLRLLAAPPA